MTLFSQTYRTIDEESYVLYKSRNSKFFAYAYPVKDEHEIKEKLDALKLKYPDASHHCYAYFLRPDYSAFRANDDGEPSGTAGKPILRQIQKLELTNTLVIVVRYFGGTLLGVPGLIEAYGESAAQCLAICTISQYDICEKYTLSSSFGMENDVYRLCKQFRLSPQLRHDDSCFSVEIRIPLRMVDDFKAAVSQNYQLNLKYTGTG